MASRTWLQTRVIQTLCGVAACATTAACSGDIDSSTEGNPWELNEWQLTEPVPSEPDLGKVPDASRDMDTPVPDMDRPDLPAPIDLGEPDMEPTRPDMTPPPDLGPQLDTTGALCQRGDTCTGGTCLLARDGWEGGYCTQRSCEQTQCRASGGDCVKDELVPDESFCAQPCNPNPQPGFDSCRRGYECRSADLEDDSESGYCLPPREEPTPEGAADGEACQDTGDCLGGTCIEESEGWPAGYCTTTGCSNRNDCATPGGEDNRCYQNPQGPNICVRICQDTSECRQDYICQPVGGGQGFCVPDPSEPLTIDFATYPLPVTCGPTTNPAQQSHTINYNIAPTTTSYMLTSLARDGRQIASESADMPSGNRVDYFQGANSYQNTSAQLFGFVNPIATPAQPEFASQLEAGAHVHTLYAESQDVCHYLIEETTPGTTLDLNIYFVGVPGINAAQAPTNANMQATLAFFSTIYANANITPGTVRYYDITGANQQSYRIVRSESDISDLVALSQLPGPTLDEALSLNVFFVQSIALGGGTIGISQGLPGPPGIHGTKASGVVFTSEFLGTTFNDPETGTLTSGNEYTGIVLAHELGHYLGLFHTTEQNAQGNDPLTDTPTCRRNQFPNGCPDLNNLMFPFAGITHTTVTPDQGFVIGVNPLSKD